MQPVPSSWGDWKDQTWCRGPGWQRECGGGPWAVAESPELASAHMRGASRPASAPTLPGRPRHSCFLSWRGVQQCPVQPTLVTLTSESSGQRQKKGQASSGPPAERTPGPVAPEPQVRPAQLGSPRQGRHRTGHAWSSEGLARSHVYALLSRSTPAAVQVTAHFHPPPRLLESPPSTVLASQSPQK